MVEVFVKISKYFQQPYGCWFVRSCYCDLLFHNHNRIQQTMNFQNHLIMNKNDLGKC